MVLKTFNVDEKVYAKFSGYCKSHGISMSKLVNMFMQSQIEEEPAVKKEYLKKLDEIRNGKFIQIDSFSERYGL